jgi:flagellar motor switch protein FliN/FliY
MGDGSLSQDEIDALLQGADDIMSPQSGGPGMAPDMGGPAAGGAMSPNDQRAVHDIVSSAVASAAPALSGYLGGKNFSITNTLVEIKKQDAIRNDFPVRYVQVSMDYSGSLNGRNLIIFSYNDAGAISSLMMGDESGKPPADLSEAHQSTIQEFTNQLLSSMATQFSGKLGGSINATPATLSMVNNPSELQLPAGSDLVKVTYDFNIPGVVNSKFFHIMDMSLSSGLSRRSSAQSQPAQQYAQPQQSYQQQVGISPVKFPPLDQGVLPSQMQNISLLLDVEMTLTVELGRTKQLVQDILGLGEGSIIELDKLAGEPVDLLVNGKLIAKGEVVVIDENFGVRVTDIVSPADRLAGIQH